MMNKKNISNTNEKTIVTISKHVPNNTKVSKLSIFSDTSWLFTEEIKLPTFRDGNKTIDFDNYIFESNIESKDTSNFILALKEFGYAKLRSPLPSYTSVQAHTLKGLLTKIRPFVLWCISKKLNGFDSVTTEHMEGFHQFLTVNEKKDGAKYSIERITKILKAIDQLYQYRGKITKPLVISPTISTTNPSGKNTGTGECRTKVIPDYIYKPLLRISFHYINVYSKDIFSLLDIRDNIISEVEVLTSNTTVKTSKYSKLFNNELSKFCISINPDTMKPWREQWTSITEFDKDVIMLRNAAWTNILGLSGIRVSEFYSITDNSLVPTNVGQGELQKFYLKGHLFKGKKIPTKETWVVNNIVNLAINVLIRLTEDLREYSKSNKLILTSVRKLLIGKNCPENISTFANSIEQPSSSTMLNGLNSFCLACHELHGESAQFKDANITTRNLRRTLAHYIAKEPFGIIAGQLQFKHVEVAMFEGYAGQDDSFLEELNEERASVSIDFLQELVDDMNDGEVYSPGSLLIASEFRGSATEKKSIEYYLKNKRMMIYPGLLSNCFFDPDAALCLKDSKGKKEKPLLNSCRPDKCQNSCITKKHIPLWQAQINDAKAMLNMKGVSEAQKFILITEVKELENAIAPLQIKEQEDK